MLCSAVLLELNELTGVTNWKKYVIFLTTDAVINERYSKLGFCPIPKCGIDIRSRVAKREP